MPAPGYTTYVAPEKLAQASRILGLGGGGNDAQRRERLFDEIGTLLREVGIPSSLAETGVPEQEYLEARDDVTRAAFGDPSLRTSPRIPLVRELRALLDAAYGLR